MRWVTIVFSALIVFFISVVTVTVAEAEDGFSVEYGRYDYQDQDSSYVSVNTGMEIAAFFVCNYNNYEVEIKGLTLGINIESFAPDYSQADSVIFQNPYFYQEFSNMIVAIPAEKDYWGHSIPFKFEIVFPSMAGTNLILIVDLLHAGVTFRIGIIGLEGAEGVIEIEPCWSPLIITEDEASVRQSTWGAIKVLFE